MKCLECKKEVMQTPGKRKKQFCNSTCRSNYWQKAKRKVWENNKPENKKRIESERKSAHEISEKINPYTTNENESEFEKMMREAAEELKIKK